MQSGRFALLLTILLYTQQVFAQAVPDESQLRTVDSSQAQSINLPTLALATFTRANAANHRYVLASVTDGGGGTQNVEPDDNTIARVQWLLNSNEGKEDQYYLVSRDTGNGEVLVSLDLVDAKLKPFLDSLGMSLLVTVKQGNYSAQDYMKASVRFPDLATASRRFSLTAYDKPLSALLEEVSRQSGCKVSEREGQIVLLACD